MKFIPGELQDYVIARTATFPKVSEFTVAKFDGGEAPAAIYHVKVTKKKVTCDCPNSKDPTRTRPCRHQTMVALWVMNGDKDPEHMKGDRK